MNSFLEYMNHYIDINEIKAVATITIIFLLSYGISKIIMYFADKHYKEVIKPTFEKHKRGKKLTEKESRIIEKYSI